MSGLSAAKTSASLTGEKAAFTAGSKSALILGFLLILAF
jgi:hypothetical protein